MAAHKPRKTPSFLLTDEHRGKIQNSSILNCLIEHAQGMRDMTATQVTAAIALMRKVLPDLSAVDHSGDVTTSYVMRAPLPATNIDEWQKTNAPPTLQ
jgi:hypothetical protein